MLVLSATLVSTVTVSCPVAQLSSGSAGREGGGAGVIYNRPSFPVIIEAGRTEGAVADSEWSNGCGGGWVFVPVPRAGICRAGPCDGGVLDWTDWDVLRYALLIHRVLNADDLLFDFFCCAADS